MTIEFDDKYFEDAMDIRDALHDDNMTEAELIQLIINYLSFQYEKGARHVRLPVEQVR